MAEVDESIKKISSHKGVVGTIVVNNEGIPIRSSMDNAQTVHYASLIHGLTTKARACVKDMDMLDDLTFIRIRSKKHEILVAPDKEFFLVVVQNPTVEFPPNPEQPV